MLVVRWWDPRGVFGIPTFEIEGELFWGDDVTDMMLEFLDNPNLFQEGDLARLTDPEVSDLIDRVPVNSV